MQSKSNEEFVREVTNLSSLFDELCQQRHVQGEIDGGALHFLEDDQLEALLAELVTVANTARYTFINLALGQDYLRDAPLGTRGFTSARKHWKGNEDASSTNTTN